jgi:hypothetical protein
MASKRTHFKVGTLVASTNSLKNIQAKRLIMAVKYSTGFPPNIINTTVIDVKKRDY